MNLFLFKGLTLGLMLSAASVQAEVQHRFMAGSVKGQIAIIGKNGELETKFKTGAGTLQDNWVLENGNILASNRFGVKEFTPNGKLVWEYKNPDRESEIHTAQPLPNGNILITECGAKRLREINRAKETVLEFPLPTTTVKRHPQFRSARKTSRGTYWVAQALESIVREYDQDGNILNEIKTSDGAKGAHAVIELPNGNVLVSLGAQKGVKEFKSDGTLVWSVSDKELKKAGVKKLGYVGGIQRLDNGNTVISILGGNPQLIELNHAKEGVWSYYNPDELQSVSGLTILDPQEHLLK